jgi:hypothetical protein
VTRIDKARRRAAGAKQVVVGAAGAGFVVALLLARAGHPGQTTSGAGQTSQPASQSSQVQSREFDDEEEGDGDGGSVQLAPASGSSSQVQTHVS